MSPTPPADPARSAARPEGRPVVALFALGGTVASAPATDGGAGTGSGSTGAEVGVAPRVAAADLVAAMPQLSDLAQVQVTQVRQVPSCEVTLDDVVDLVSRLRAAVSDGARGLVVTQGTDTLEETAFALDLLWPGPEPVVVTGAMRPASAPGADGPAHLVAATRLAAGPEAQGAGVLVCLGDEIHAARHVRKTHTSAPSAFTSPGRGPLGWFSEGRPVLASLPPRLPELDVETGTPLPAVAVLRIGVGEDPRLLEAVADLGYDGVVVEALGGGHVPQALLPALDALVRRVPVLLASRTGAGRVLEQTYGYPGGDIDLVARGLVPVGTLDAPKARVLLTLALAAGFRGDDLADLVRRVGG
ncbi:asparaginase [Nocardioides malaquae]|uniref:asparaginase n=1 Tax=Nocardioides malaquae TaxID=2773426 RepID=UPI0029D40EE2|nr:asparaginase [Nocardioides malaquae]